MLQMKLLLLALCALQDPEPPKEVLIDLKLREASEGRPRLGLDGTCNLPDGVLLLVEFLSVPDRVDDAGDLKPDRMLPSRDSAKVLNQLFHVMLRSSLPGRRIVDVSVYRPHEQAALPEAYRDLPGIHKKWRFEFGAWRSDLPVKLAERLPETKKLMTDLRAHIGILEAATATEVLWKEKSEAVCSEGKKLEDRAMQLFTMKDSLPGTLDYLLFVAAALNAKSASFVFREGKLAGSLARDRLYGLSRFDGAIFWSAYRDALEESLKIAGRELSLWTVRLLRETPEKDWPAIRESLAKVKPAPELDPWLKKLRTSKPTDLDALEKQLRAPTVDIPK